MPGSCEFRDREDQPFAGDQRGPREIALQQRRGPRSGRDFTGWSDHGQPEVGRESDQRREPLEPRSTRRAITAKSWRIVSPCNAGPIVLERGSEEVHPCGSLTVSVPPPSKARKRNFPSGPVLTTWVRSPWASVTCANAAPAAPRSP